MVGVLLLSVGARGQEVVAQLSLDKREPRPLVFAYTQGDGGLVTIAHPSRKSSRVLSVIKYDGSFQRQWIKPLMEVSDRRTLEGLYVLGDEILVFYNEHFPRENLIRLYMNRYSLDGTKEESQAVVAESTNEKKAHALFHFTRSIDRTWLVAVGQLNPPNTDRQMDRRSVSLSYLVLRAGTPLVQQGQTDLPYVNEEFDWQETAIGQEGQFWVLGRIVPNGEERESQTYGYTILQIDPRKQTHREIKLDFADRNVTDLILKPDREDNLVVAGFYSDRRNDQLIGVLYARLTKESDTLVAATYTRFPNEFLANFLSKAQIERGREIKDLYLDHMVLRADGGALLISEEFYITTNTYNNPAQPYPNYNPYYGYSNAYGTPYGYYNVQRYYNYGDIAAVSISPTGRVEWTSVLQKFQVAPDKTQLSYFPFVVADRILFFYRGTDQGTGSNVFLAQMDYDGRVTTPRPFFQYFRNSDEFYCSQAEQISNCEAILLYYSTDSRQFTIAKLRY